MNQPGSKYFKGRCIRGEHVLHYVVWDGVRNFENKPPLHAIARQFPGTALHIKVDTNAIDDVEVLITSPLARADVGSLVVWTCDHQTYRRVVEYLIEIRDCWLT